MTFLNPAVLFGLIATAIPVLIHLLNLRKLKKIDFSTLSFLKELQKNKIRKVKLKQWLLLVLRFLIILFLVGAFARPALKGISIGGTTSSAKTTAVFIIDNTFSMSVVDEKGSYFNRAKQVVKNILSELQDGDEIAIIPAAGLNNQLRLTNNLSEVKKTIDELEISSVSGTLHYAVLEAARLLEGSKNFNKEIYLLTDFQKSRLAERDETISDLSQLLDERVKMYTFDFSGKEIYNIAVETFEAGNQIFEKDKQISFNAQIKNYSKQPVNNLVASLYINGERSAQQSINLAEYESKKILFETILKHSGFINAQVEIEDDDIIQDNKGYLSLNIPEQINVLILSENPNDAKFVELPLQVSSENNFVKTDTRNIAQLQSVNLSGYDATIIIADNFAGYADKLKSYIKEGGSILILPGSNGYFNQFKNSCSALQINTLVSAAGNINSGKSTAIFDQVDFEHPVFTGMFTKGTKKKIESPEIYFYYRQNTQGSGNNIIALSDNSSFLAEYKIEKGKIFILSVSPVLSWSNFPLKGIFVPLIYKSVLYLAAKDNANLSGIAGEEVDINLQKISGAQITIQKPSGIKEAVNLNNFNSQNYINYRNTAETGIYKVFSGDKQFMNFTINTNPLESNTEKLKKDEFDDYLKKINFKGTVVNLKPDENYFAKIQQARFGSELWKIFLIIAFVLALIEMMVARSAKKDLV
ncbi:MAG: VWA domain-containing protein [Ignavibacteriales bacterium]|nr:MAG: VWA domain-containing protein [Ignavibacteriales bacterium]